MRRGDVGDDKNLGRRLRSERQQAQGKLVDASRSGPLFRWTGGPIPEDEV